MSVLVPCTLNLYIEEQNSIGNYCIHLQIIFQIDCSFTYDEREAPHCDKSRFESLFIIVYIVTDMVATAVLRAALMTVLDL